MINKENLSEEVTTEIITSGGTKLTILIREHEQQINEKDVYITSYIAPTLPFDYSNTTLQNFLKEFKITSAVANNDSTFYYSNDMKNYSKIKVNQHNKKKYLTDIGINKNGIITLQPTQPTQPTQPDMQAFRLPLTVLGPLPPNNQILITSYIPISYLFNVKNATLNEFLDAFIITSAVYDNGDTFKYISSSHDMIPLTIIVDKINLKKHLYELGITNDGKITL